MNDESLSHSARRRYDPVKRREYYLRTRKLKGRKKGRKEDELKGRRVGTSSSSKARYRVTFDNGTSTTYSAEDLRQKKAKINKRVQTVKKKLNTLNTLLRKRLAEAKRNEKKATKPKTAAEKSKASREAKKYRARNQQKIKTASKRTRETKKPNAPKTSKKTTSVKEIRSDITKLKTELKTITKALASMANAKRIN